MALYSKLTNRVENMLLKTDEEISKDMKIIREWLIQQPHLPVNIDDFFIKRFLRCCSFSIEQTKNLIDLFYTLRSQAPEIFSNRDPQDPKLQQLFEIIDLAPLPILTKNNHKLFIYRLNDNDVSKFNYTDAVKVFFMVADIRIFTEDSEAEGEIPIFDMSCFTLRHITKISLPILKKYMAYTQEAHPIRLKQIHVQNTPPFLDKCLAIVRPFLKGEVAKLLNFHQPNSTTLYDFIPTELLPQDYGGTLPPVKEIKAEWMNKVMANRDFYTDETRWKVDESKRPTNNKNNYKQNGLEGSFRTLEID